MFMRWSFRKLKASLLLGLGMGASGMGPGPAGADVGVVLDDQPSEISETVETKKPYRLNAEDSRLTRAIVAALKD
jgi:hypothetical protein